MRACVVGPTLSPVNRIEPFLCTAVNLIVALAAVIGSQGAQNVLFVVNERTDFLSLVPWFCKHCLQVVDVGEDKSAVILQEGENPFKASSGHASLSIFHRTKDVRGNVSRR